MSATDRLGFICASIAATPEADLATVRTIVSSSAPLEALRALVRREVPHLEDDRYFHPDIATATKLVSDGAVIDAVGDVALPSLERLR